MVVVGDVFVDRWVYCSATRLSPEGPFPVLNHERMEEAPGGAGNVAENLRALGCELRAPFTTKTSIKTRFVAAGHQLLRWDIDKIGPLSEDETRRLFISIEQQKPQVLVISDYTKGVCTPELCQALIAWSELREVKVVAAAKGNWEKYEGADLACLNEAEERAIPIGTVMPKSVLVTRGAKGMTLYQCGQPDVNILGRGVCVKDVAGCGDTVTAVVAAALAIGADLVTAATWANAAASVVVSKRGTSVCSIEELEAALA